MAHGFLNYFLTFMTAAELAAFTPDPPAVATGQPGQGYAIYVTDTGNKRIQVFGLDGTFKRMFGGSGTAPGQFNEEVGVALQLHGTSLEELVIEPTLGSIEIRGVTSPVALGKCKSAPPR